MIEESRRITLGLADVPLSETLGSYHIYMRSVRVHYTNNLDEGSFDAERVSMYGGPEGLCCMPINGLQYGFTLHADCLESRDPVTLRTHQNSLRVFGELNFERAAHTSLMALDLRS